MPTLSIVDSLTTGAVNVNLLTGSKFEFAAVPEVVEVYAVNDTANTATAIDEITLTLGNVVVGDALAIPFNEVPNSSPRRDQNLIVSGVAAAGDRLQIRRVNGQAGTTVARFLIVISPLA